MTKWNVYVTNEIPQPALDMLAEHCDLEVNREGKPLLKSTFLQKIQGRDAVLCLLTDQIDAEVLRAANQAKIFANYAVGYNNIDIPAATAHGIMISNTPGVLTDTTAEMAWALLFSVARRVVESDNYTRMGKYEGWGPMLFLGQDIFNKTVGIIGPGRIGLSFAKRAKAFDMKVLYTGNKANPQFEHETGGQYVSLAKLLQNSDYVSIHTPLLPETFHLIGEKEFKQMKNTAILINTSRGPVVDELALVKALETGEIWGAGLDVYEWEPKLAEGLSKLDNVTLCPHIASATIETRTKMGMIAAVNIIAAMKGELPPNCLNPEVHKSSSRQKT
ncbi:putative 2-hydroxyacid dehydrogenase [Desulfosporosinus acididurans]|uniref:Putative 2-hydroxyacid dehydrogenase n=1 Tax=Desulfosporosinus acididurans TaxID=476652 RepID=A0A0J1FQ64_9FIRM|nr:D-glycerate dehydrogenase [Desulfosporosinus acididurans]KLU65457.1 putative 2-hydroxyacid dehydrogenase [Desulfosporosinus acididurans]